MYVSTSDGSGGQGGIAWQGKPGVNYKLGPGEPALGYEYPGAAAPFLTIANHTVSWRIPIQHRCLICDIARR